MDYLQRYNQWITDEVFDEATRQELIKIKDDTKAIEDRFYRDLEFGTGGLRGVIGAGTNRMNVYTVARATQGIANYIVKNKIENPSVVIAHDSRNFSREFACEAARVLNYNNIKVYLFDELRPTPELSFAVRHLGATAGIVVTASHNPPEYNGYKVYWSDGAQVVSPIAEALIQEANSISDFAAIPCIKNRTCSAMGELVEIGKEIDDIYVEKVKNLSLNGDLVRKAADSYKIVYTPIHGSGNKLVRRVLAEIGFENVLVVKEQELPDGNFSTVKSPNPEEQEAFTLAIELAKNNNADVIVGTDPDCDRVGVVVRDKKGEYIVLTGNQTGALLIDYVLSSMKSKAMLNSKSTVIDTIVTSKMGAKIAESYGVNVVSVLTGFKYIAEKIKEFDITNQKDFVFGYEESYGYLAGKFVRDKDAVIASMLICEMGAWYKSKGMTIYEGLIALYEKHGFYKEALTSIAFKGKEGMDKMKSILDYLRANPLTSIDGVKIKETRDYMNYVGPIVLPKENVLYYILEDNSWFALRPSGTEPKLKIYFSVIGDSMDTAVQKVEKLKVTIKGMIEKL